MLLYFEHYSLGSSCGNTLCKWANMFYGIVNRFVYWLVSQQYTVIDWVWGQQQFVWPEHRSVALSLWVPATDPFKGQTKLLMSEKPVYNCFVIHLHFFKKKLYSLFPLTFQYPRPSSLRIMQFDILTLWHQYQVTYWTNENKAIDQQFDSGQ